MVETSWQDETERGRALIDRARQQVERAQAAETEVRTPSLPADAFPGYALLEQIHRGGQGVVYKAEQASTHRAVAIKVLRDGPLADGVERARFEREVEVLSQLRHPNIVTLHDGGTAGGFHFYVMDYVDGQPLDRFMSGRRLSIEDTLRLFHKICMAIDAAHLRGVIHRDLKPRNILVDDDGEPHILDFGLARFTHGADGRGDLTAQTITGQFVGSIPWASPEQAGGSTDSIDIRTDVYALGLVLYHMLTGTFPYEVHGSIHRVLTAILDTEPCNPSTHRPDINEEVDTIILKCLSKEREQRYHSAGDLARDIERYLSGEAIEAKRHSGWYVLKKTVRRHWAPVGAAAVLVIATGIYALTASSLYRNAVTAERKAEDTAKDALDMLRTLAIDVSDRLRNFSGADEARKFVLEQAGTRLERLVERYDDPADPQIVLARALHALGDIDQALGRYRMADSHLRRALEIRRELAASDPENLTWQADLSIALVRVGDVAQHLDDRDTRRRHYETALGIDERLAAAEPDNIRFQDNLLWSYERNGHVACEQGLLTTAGDFFDRQLALAEALADRYPDEVACLQGLRAAHGQGRDLAMQLERWDDAYAHARKLVELSERLSETSPDSCELHRGNAYACMAAARTFLRAGNHEEARSTIARAESEARLFQACDPEDEFDTQWLLSGVYVQRGAIAAAEGNASKHEADLRAQLDILDRLFEMRPTDDGVALRLVYALSALGRALRATGDEMEARAVTERAFSVVRPLAEQRSASAGLLVAGAHLSSRPPYDDLKDANQAIRWATRAAELSDYNDPSTVSLLAQLQSENGEHEAAIRLLERIVALDQFPESPRRQRIVRTLETYRAMVAGDGAEPN